MKRQAAVYSRISRDRVGAGLGVERQRDDCRQVAEQLGWTIVAEHTDNDMSAYSGKPRPGYRALLADLREGRADAVLAWHTDRLHRSPAELEEYITVCETVGAPTHCVKAGPLDLTSPSGRLVARQLGAVARYEVEHSIERQKRAKAQAAADGRFRGGRRAFGYEADGLTVRDDEAARVRDMTDRVLAGESVRSIAAELNAAGSRGTRGGNWTGASVRDVLLRARNAGLVEHDGDVVGPAQWPEIVPVETWHAVRAVLAAPDRSKPGTRARRWLLSGLAHCGVCGEPVRVGSAGTVKPHARPYYRCSSQRVHVSRVAEPVDDYVTRVILARLAQPDAARLLADREAAEDTDRLCSEANAARVRLDELANLYAAGTIDARQLTTGTEQLRANITDLEQRIGAVAAGSSLDGLVGVLDVEAVWQTLSLDRRRAVVDALVTVTILRAARGRRSGGLYFDPSTVAIAWNNDVVM